MATVLFAACDKSGGTSPSGSASASTSPSASASASGGGSSSQWPKEIGYFDRDYDYTQQKKFKIAYLIPSGGSFLYAEFDKAFESWAKRMNMDYKGMIGAADTSTEAYISLVQTHIDQGFNGLLLDGVGDQMGLCLEMAKEAGVHIWSCMGITRDRANMYVYQDVPLDGRMWWPFIGFDDYYAGSSMMKKLIQWKEEAWPDVPWDRVGVICVGFSQFGQQLYSRVQGSKYVWCKRFPQFGEYLPGAMDNPKNLPLTSRPRRRLSRRSSPSTRTTSKSGSYLAPWTTSRWARPTPPKPLA